MIEYNYGVSDYHLAVPIDHPRFTRDQFAL